VELKRTPVRDIVWLFIATRLLLIFITYISYILFTAPNYSNTPVDVFALLTSWDRQEVTTYLRIAQYGYRTLADLAFFPLFPWLIAGISHFLESWSYLLVGTLISNATLLGTLLIIYRLIVDAVGDHAAQRTLLYLCIFPTAFSFFVSYNEALYLLLVTGTFLAIQRQNWWLAGLVGLLATLARLDGIFLVIPYLYELWMQRTSPGSYFHALLYTLLPVILIPLGTTIYAIYCWQAFGDPLAFVKTLDTWSHSFIWPWQALSELFWVHPQPFGSAAQASLLLNLSAALGFILLVILGWRKIRASYSIWQCCLLLFMLETLGIGNTGNLLSNQHFVLTLFPGFLTLALLGKQYPRLHYALLSIFPALQAVLGIAFLLKH
jgi:Gpi18-like mannosyltransferase